MVTTRKYLNISEVAEDTGLSEPFWRKAVFRRQIPYLKLGRRVLIERAVLDQWISERAIPSRPNPQKEVETREA